MSGIINFFVSCAGGLIKGVISHTISGGGGALIGGSWSSILDQVCMILLGIGSVFG